MIVDVEFINIGKIEVQLTFRMTFEEWKELRSSLNFWPADLKLRGAIDDVIRRLEGQVGFRDEQ